MRWLLLLLTLLPVALSFEALSLTDPYICPSIEITHIQNFTLLRHCKIVVGHIRLANLELPHPNAKSPFAKVHITDQIRTSVEEVTDYLLVYRVNGLRTLESIFPRLRIIRGKGLLYDEYSLAVYENRHLRELGLASLLRIQSGNVRIENNPSLCFVHTVNWVYLLANNTAQYYITKNNRSPNHCPVCLGVNDDYFRENGTKYCWNSVIMQQRPVPFSYKNCPKECGANGCDEDGACCSRGCVTSCNDLDCAVCAHYKHRSSQRCVDRCAASFRLFKRECVTAFECRKLARIPIGNECVDDCPDSHRMYVDSVNMAHCKPDCEGDFVIKRAEDVRRLRECVTIVGTLSIELDNVKEEVVEELENALSLVNEITGWLKVSGSPQLISLGFLKNLDTIKGTQLLNDKYALLVVGNDHLEQIWAPNHQVAILRGSIFFHLNPRLCYEKILALKPSLKMPQKLTVSDISFNSNGERTICGKGVRILDAVIEDFNATAIRIAVNLMTSDHLEVLMGYSYHYKEAPERNVTMYDGRHGCGHDNWLMDVTIDKNRRHIISNLKPYTQYAFFVKTVTRTDYHTQIDAYSSIYYFRTLAMKPTPVSKIIAESTTATEILVHWWPPLRPNGIIGNYYVSYEPVKKFAFDTNRNSTLDDSCVCNIKSPYHSGPLPDDEDFYNKEQIIYEEALPNLIYVSRRQREMAKKEKFGRVSDYSDLVNPSQGPHLETPRVETTTMKPINKSAIVPGTNQTVGEARAQAEKKYIMYRQNLEQRAILIQDNGPEAFPILRPTPVCKEENPTAEMMLKNNCTALEHVEGIKVNGSQHTLLLQNLKTEHAYRISIRACVEGLLNGCSKPKTIVTETVSKSIEEFLHRLHDYY